MVDAIGGDMFPICALLGGWDACLEIVEAAWGRKPSRELQMRWRRMGRITGDTVRLLKEACEANGIESADEDFVSTVGPISALRPYSEAALARAKKRAALIAAESLQSATVSMIDHGTTEGQPEQDQ